jgi:hypothetical protein
MPRRVFCAIIDKSDIVFFAFGDEKGKKKRLLGPQMRKVSLMPAVTRDP